MRRFDGDGFGGRISGSPTGLGVGHGRGGGCGSLGLVGGVTTGDGLGEVSFVHICGAGVVSEVCAEGEAVRRVVDGQEGPRRRRPDTADGLGVRTEAGHWCRDGGEGSSKLGMDGASQSAKPKEVATSAKMLLAASRTG